MLCELGRAPLLRRRPVIPLGFREASRGSLETRRTGGEHVEQLLAIRGCNGCHGAEFSTLYIATYSTSCYSLTRPTPWIPRSSRVSRIACSASSPSSSASPASAPPRPRGRLPARRRMARPAPARARLQHGRADRGAGPSGGVGREPAGGRPADAAHLRPLRRAAAGPARRMDHARRSSRPFATASSTRAAPATTRARSSACSRPTRRCSTRTATPRSTCISSSRARRSAAATSSPTCCTRARSAPQADAVLVCDMSYYAPGWPAVYTALRGMCYAEISVRTLQRDLHSGTYGGVAPNALETLVRILSRTQGRRRRDPDPQAVQGGEGARRRPSSRAGRSCRSTRPQYLEQEVTGQGADRAQGVLGAGADLGASDLRDPRHQGRLRRRRRQDGDSRQGGGQGEPAAGARARARQGGQVARRRRWQGWRRGGPRSRSPCCTAAIRSRWTPPPGIRGAGPGVRGGHGAAGGARPGRRVDSDRAEARPGRRARCILTGIGLPDDGLHSPNEKLDLQQIWSGIRIFGRFLELFAEKGGAAEERVK